MCIRDRRITSELCLDSCNKLQRIERLRNIIICPQCKPCLLYTSYTRTKALFPEFAEALSHTDHVILADIYAARETDTLGISSKDLADAIAEKGADVYYFPSFEEIENFCREHCQKGDVLITMGAGDEMCIRDRFLCTSIRYLL